MKNMVCIITGQPLPNFIPVNEPATRPDALYCMLTKGNALMEKRYTNLKEVVEKLFPQVSVERVDLQDAFKPRHIQEACFSLLKENASESDWTLNATGGTKLMSAPAIEVFRTLGHQFLYVETGKNMILRVDKDWQIEEVSFQNCIALPDYFQLYGQAIGPHNVLDAKMLNSLKNRLQQESSPMKKASLQQELRLFTQLEKLQWQVWPNVQLVSQKVQYNEYDALAVWGYRLFAFECKRMHEPAIPDERDAQNDRIQIDLLKLNRLQKDFGANLGRVYWVLEGNYHLNNAAKIRLKEFGVTFIEDGEVPYLPDQHEDFGMPPEK